jgi:PAS domain S-box-containing protein
VPAVTRQAPDNGGTGLLRRLQRTEGSLQMLAQAIPNAFFYIDNDYRVELANREFTRPLGKSLDEVLGQPIDHVLGAEIYAQHSSKLEAAMRGQTVVYEATVRLLDGEKRYLKISNKPAYDEHGDLVGVLSQSVDITELKRLEQKAKESESRFRRLAEGVPNHFLFLDSGLKVVFCNDHFLQRSGWTMDDALGRHISELLGPEVFAKRHPYYERALRGETVTYEADGAIGSPGYFQFQHKPSFDSEGRVIGFFSVAMDISERRRMELELEAKQAELMRSNQDLEQFAYVASHDLKAPLRAIDLLVKWIREDLGDYPAGDVQDNLTLLAQRTERLTRLLDDLLAYSRAGRRVGQIRRTDTSALVREVVEMLAPPREISVRVSELPVFQTYNSPLEQVLRNLIGNAVKHHPGPTGTIAISCADAGEFYEFAIEDDGSGIPLEYAERVFQMFQTLKPRDEVEGSGMGLAIVQRIVAWQGGRVWFEERPDGRSGTVFKFQWRKMPASTMAVTSGEQSEQSARRNNA